MNSLPVLKFDDDGKVCNLEELFKDVEFTQEDYSVTPWKRVVAWLDFQDCVLHGDFFIWGIVVLELTENFGYYTYSILSEERTKKALACAKRGYVFNCNYKEKKENQVEIQ